MIIDCERHVLIPALDAILAHLDPAWRSRLGASEFILPQAGPHPGVELEACEDYGAVDPREAANALADDVLATVLVPAQALPCSNWLSPATAAKFVAAVNDYVIAEWLPADDRFLFAPVVAPHHAGAAAAEIRRVGVHPAAAAVCMPLTGINMGQAHYHPIYAALEELGLPLMVHPSGGEGNVVGPPVLGGVGPRTPEETYALLPQVAMTNISSLIFDGVLERFPGLKVIFAGFGFAWAPPVLWRADAEFRGLRVDVPWVTRPPSEYIADHVRLVVDGSGECPASGLDDLIGLLPDNLLLYGSDAPYGQVDVLRALDGLDPAKRDLIVSANALATLRMVARRP